MAVAELLLELLRRTHLSAPSDIAAVVADQAASMGAVDVVIYLTDYEHRALVPLPRGGEGPSSPLSVAGTVAGRAFASTTILKTPVETGGQRLWRPLLDGTERLGTLGMCFAVDELSEDRLEASEPLRPSGRDAVSELIEREASAGKTAPETLRRIRHAILDREEAELRDDATALLIEWGRGDERRLLPQTVL